MNIQDNSSLISLQWTSIYGETQVVQWLLQRGATLEIQSKNGDTPRMSVIFHGLGAGIVTLFKLLIDKSQNFYLKKYQGEQF